MEFVRVPAGPFLMGGAAGHPSERPVHEVRLDAFLIARTPANPLGLTDLAGVCHEWCGDWFDESYYARSPATNPRGPAAGTRRASRGGAWRHADPWSPVAHRSSLPPHLHYSDYGVRLARDA